MARPPPAAQSSAIPPMTPSEEDNVIHTRINNDERSIKRIIKKYHTYSSLSSSSKSPAVNGEQAANLESAREAFLIELASFQLAFQKGLMICEAEVRQVEEYQRERARIDDEHGILRGQIEQLKTSLEEAQLVRRRKMEYDAVAEKVNTLPPRDELEATILSLENDITAIRAEHETQNKFIQSQKAALDAVILDLGSLRLMGKDSGDINSSAPSPGATPAPDLPPGEEPESDKHLTEGEAASGVVSNHEPGAASRTEQEEDDIEMGEVEEDVKSLKGRKKREDMEEGEATDGDSELSELPEDA